MGKKRVTLFVDSQTYNNFKKHCDKNGWVISKQIENFMVRVLKKIKSKSF